MIPPNLFSYATSELSQDAFICWLVAWANVPDHPLGDVGRAFVRLLLEVDLGESVDAQVPVTVTCGPKRQHYQTDVYFRATVGKRERSFILEDKTLGSPNTKRLNERRDNIRGTRPKDELFSCIYFKTGFLYPADRDVVKHGYSILDAERLHHFLVNHAEGVDSEICQAYIAHLHDAYVQPQRDDYPALLAGRVSLLERAPVQWQFMTSLREKLLISLPVELRTHPFEIRGVRRGTSRGRPWTQLDVGSVDGVLDGLNERLFYRVDRRKAGYYVALRQWSGVMGKPAAKAVKLDRLRQHRKAVRNLEDMTPLKLGHPTGDHQGHQESEILVLFLGTDNSPAAVLDGLPAFHQQLIVALRAADLEAPRPSEA